SAPSGSFSLDVLRLYASSQRTSSNPGNGGHSNTKQSNCCCTIEDLVKETSPAVATRDHTDHCQANRNSYKEFGESSCRHHDHDHHFCRHHQHEHPFELSFFEESSSGTFVSSERRLMRNLLLL